MDTVPICRGKIRDTTGDKFDAAGNLRKGKTMDGMAAIPAGDPRTKGFNYGAPLPVPADDPMYIEAERVSSDLDHISHETGERAWRLTMALRDYRHACTRPERALAGAKLAIVLREVSPFAPVNGGDPTPNYTFDEIASIGRRVRERESAYAGRWLLAADDSPHAKLLREARGEVAREAIVTDGRDHSV